MRRALSMLTLLITMQGCQGKNPGKPQTAAKVASPAYQRFVPIPPSSFATALWHGDFALDTKTGQLCATWQTHLTPYTDKTAPLLEMLPHCLDLYNKYPDVGQATAGGSAPPATPDAIDEAIKKFRQEKSSPK